MSAGYRAGDKAGDKKGGRRGGGFSLLELLVALLVIAISVVLATPLMQPLQQGIRLKAGTARLLEAINLARQEAVTRSVPVAVCPSPMTFTGEAACSASYADGWIVFSDRDRNRQLDAPEDVLLQSFAGLPEGYRVTNRAGTAAAAETILYFPDGSSRRNMTLQLCPPTGSRVSAPSIVLNIVGRPRVEQDWGQCPAA